MVLALAHSLSGSTMAEADKLWELRAESANATKAVMLYQELLKQNPTYEGYLKLARGLAFQGRFHLKEEQEQEKMAAFTRCIGLSVQAGRLNPGGLEAVFVNGMCHAERAKVDQSLGDARRAKNAMERVLKEKPLLYDGLAYTILGKLYFEIPGWPISFGDNDKAIEILRKVLAINPRNRYNYFFLSEVLWSEGFKNEAKDILKRGMDLPPDPLFLVEDQDCLKEMRLFQKKEDIK